jgi:phenylacetate-CoA ligase
MKQLLANNIGFPLKDLYTQSPILKTYKFLKDSQYWSEDEILNYQFLKLKRILTHAYENIPFYTKKYQLAKIHPSDIRNLNDIKKIPILTKEEIRGNEESFLEHDWRKKRYFKTKTGGTTGPPTIIFKDTNSYAFSWASYYRWLDWIGLELGAKTITIWGASTILSKSIINNIFKKFTDFLTNQKHINSFNIKHEEIYLILSIINKFKPDHIKGYLSSIILIADYINKNKITLEYIPKAVSTTSETLYPFQRQSIEIAFQCPVYDQYGCTEINSISFECNYHQGMHINQEHVILEVFNDLKNSYTKNGSLILTDLDCMLMPLIRYKNGDSATLSDEKCSCGIKHPLIKSIDGREAVTICLKDGSEVHGVFFTDLLYELPGNNFDIDKFQIYQNSPGVIEFRYESRAALDKSSFQNLDQAFKRYFSNIKYKRYDFIPPEKSGKHSYLKRE